MHVSVLMEIWKASERVGDLTAPQHMRHVFIVMYLRCKEEGRGGGRRRKEKEEEAGPGQQAGMIMPSWLCYLAPWRPSALCAACVRSPRRSFLCSWTAAGNGVYSRIHPEEPQRCQGCRHRTSRSVRNQSRRRQKHWGQVLLGASFLEMHKT